MSAGRRVLTKGTALAFVVLLGVVSLFADATYEGARSVMGPFLAVLGATGAVTGFVVGAGELAGYAMRLVAGYLSDRTRQYWAFVFAGYFLNLVAVPLLAIAGNWQAVFALVVLERFGKAIRTPARDAILSSAAKTIGRGWGFGLHEALDQVGAVLGPLVVAAVLYFNGTFAKGFLVLAVPAALAMVSLVVAKRFCPRAVVSTASRRGAGGRTTAFPSSFWLYIAFVAAGVAGFAPFQLISYHSSVSSVFSGAEVSLLFALAMGVDALAALATGRFFDQKGPAVLLAAPVLSIVAAPLVFSPNQFGVVAGIILWGAVLGIHESILRATVGGMVPARAGGSAYGAFNAVYGFSFFAGSSVMGALYGAGTGFAIAFSVAVEAIALALFLAWLGRAKPAGRTTT